MKGGGEVAGRIAVVSPMSRFAYESFRLRSLCLRLRSIRLLICIKHKTQETP